MVNDNLVLASIRSDNALTSILSNFDSNYIISTVRDSINMRFRPYESPLPTLSSFENSFQAILKNVDPTNLERIQMVREKTYEEIINEICNYYYISFNQDSNVDIYSSAYWLYDFFVNNFTEHFFHFFTKFITVNKSYLYQSLNLESLKKEKDSSTVYSKKLFPDQELGLIYTNMNIVLDNIVCFDITLEQIIEYSNLPNHVKQFFYNTVKDINSDIFKRCYVSIYNSPYRTDIITNIKLRLQDSATSQDVTINYTR